ncbi:MAG: cell division protein ZapA [Gemmatimonadaceae bacterium]
MVKVRIAGDEYPIRTDQSPEHTKAVAEHVDRTIRAIMDAGVNETSKAAILAALQITDELFKERQGADELTGEIRQLANDIRPLLPPAKRTEAI